MQTSNFGFGYTTVFFRFGPVIGYFCPCWALHQYILGVRVRFNNFFVTQLCRLSTLVLEVQPYLIVLICPHLEHFCPFQAFQGLFLAWVGAQKGFRNLSMQTINFSFGITALPFFIHSAPFGAFWTLFGPFWALWSYFGVGVRSNNFLGPTFIA